MESDLQDLFDELHSIIRYRTIGLVCQTLLYGIYLCLVPIAVHAMVTNGLRTRARKWLLAITTSMFALSTVSSILYVAFTVMVIVACNSSVMACYGSDNASLCILSELAKINKPAKNLLAMFPFILLINFIIADGIVVWRAWVLCSDQSKVVLMIPVIMLAINTIIYLMVVVLRVVELIILEEGKVPHAVFNIIPIGQVAQVALSLSINIFATSIIALKAWKHRKLLMESGMGVRTPGQAIRILTLLVESGAIYILIGVVSLASITIFLHFGLGNISTIFMLVGTQLVGIYPIAVVLLVEKNRSLNSTFCSSGTIIDVRGDRPLQVAEPMSFAPERVLASAGQIDLTKPPNTDVYISFDTTLEPGDAGMGAGSSKVSSEKHAVS